MLIYIAGLLNKGEVYSVVIGNLIMYFSLWRKKTYSDLSMVV
jgi:hypothetical protein